MSGLIIAIGNFISGGTTSGGAPAITFYLLWKSSTDRMLVSASSSDKLVWK
jgi:hypothetical protein